MGPNGSGKSTLVKAILGDEDVKVQSGELLLCKQKELEMEKKAEKTNEDKRKEKNGMGCINLLNMSTSQRAEKGIFVGFQHPPSIPGVSFVDLLFFAYKKLFGDETVSLDEFYDKLEIYAKELGIDEKLMTRNVNEGLSGGEKKKMELLQMLVLKPQYIFLDEPDSGMDADSVKMIQKAVSIVKKDCAVAIISHNPQNLDIKNYDEVVVFKDGKIVRRGDSRLIEKVSEEGYGQF
jgi:Fe-S cluster assembly ATP-binding protein